MIGIVVHVRPCCDGLSVSFERAAPAAQRAWASLYDAMPLDLDVTRGERLRERRAAWHRRWHARHALAVLRLETALERAARKR